MPVYELFLSQKIYLENTTNKLTWGFIEWDGAWRRMKIHIFLGGNKHELFFEEMKIKFLVHKNLINESTGDMIQKYMASRRTPRGINVNITNNIYRFEPAGCKGSAFVEGNENYLWYAL